MHLFNHLYMKIKTQISFKSQKKKKNPMELKEGFCKVTIIIKCVHTVIEDRDVSTKNKEVANYCE